MLNLLAARFQRIPTGQAQPLSHKSMSNAIMANPLGIIQINSTHWRGAAGHDGKAHKLNQSMLCVEAKEPIIVSTSLAMVPTPVNNDEKQLHQFFSAMMANYK